VAYSYWLLFLDHDYKLLNISKKISKDNCRLQNSTSLKTKSKLWAHANECFINQSNSILQLFLNERLWCFFRFCVEYRQLNHNIVVQINICPVSEKTIGCQARQQPVLGDISINGEKWNVWNLILLILWFCTGKITDICMFLIQFELHLLNILIVNYQLKYSLLAASGVQNRFDSTCSTRSGAYYEFTMELVPW
jgi:hypothetical protein